jgi:hypothetical protein
MEMRVVAPAGKDGVSSFSDRALTPTNASSASQASAPGIGAEPTRLDQVSAWRSPACGRPSQSEPLGSEAGSSRDYSEFRFLTHVAVLLLESI